LSGLGVAARAALFACVLAGSSGGAAWSASFDCAEAQTRSQLAICDDARLSARDEELARLLQGAGAYRAGVERAWLDEREGCVGDMSCLARAYDTRIAYLRELGPQATPESAPADDGAVAEPTVRAASAAAADAPTETAAPTAAEPTTDVQGSQAGAADSPASTTAEDGDGAAMALGMIMLGLVLLALYGVPTIIAFARGHAYKWVILAINVFAGWTGLGWLTILVWAVWPREKALIDPVVGNVTGTGARNAGDAIGAADYGRLRGFAQEQSQAPGSAGALSAAQMNALEQLVGLRDKGVLTEAEFLREKNRILGLA
jgi:uncharacterized protein